MEDSRTTVALFSKDLCSFPSGDRQWFCELPDAHAPEIVSFDGRFYIIRVSGPDHSGKGAPERGGWLEIASLSFK